MELLKLILVYKAAYVIGYLIELKKYYRYISFIKNTTNILKFKIMNIMLR